MKETNIKTSWRDVTISEYYDIKNKLKEDISNYEKEVALIAFVYNISEDDVYDKTIFEVKNMQKKLAWINEPIDIPQDVKFKKIKIKNDKYVVNTNLQKFSIGQYIDFQTFFPKRFEDQNYIGNLLACFLIPKGHKYNENYDIQQVIDDINTTVDIMTAYEIIFFFLKQYLISIKDMQNYFNIQMRILKKLPLKNKEKVKDLQEKWEQMQKNISAGLLL